jgi:hypothetical protein
MAVCFGLELGKSNTATVAGTCIHSHASLMR